MNAPGFDEQRLQKMKTQPGFVAALDQSGGSTPNPTKFSTWVRQGVYLFRDTFA